MAALQLLCSATTFPILALMFLLFRCIYRLSPLHRLYHIPGPIRARLTSLWLTYHSWAGDEASTVHSLHLTYGPIVVVGPNAVDIADGAALSDIYVEKGGFRKPEYYLNFTVDGYRTIFSEVDSAARASRAKAVLPVFGPLRLRQGREAVYACVQKWIDIIGMEAKVGRPVDVLGLSRSFAIDAASEYLFGHSYGALDIDRRMVAKKARGEERGRADGMIDAFDAVGRYWYLPPWAYGWVDWVRITFFANAALRKTFLVMDAYVNQAVEGAANAEKSSLAGRFQGRLLSAGITVGETKAQCKDALLAGVDTTGYNLAHIIFQLAKHPEIYQALRKEIQDSIPTDDQVQCLPYLRGVVQEGLRISTANPTRIPRVVPRCGWHFRDTFFPSGVEVSCSSYELHHNPAVFDCPQEFRPERWLKASREMDRDYIPFGVGFRRCIAMNLALVELYCAIHKLVEYDLLSDAQPCEDGIELKEWFNSKVVGGTIDLKWESGHE
ncbi:uncharacterized protein A1O9_13011 [Exophiala aquamarina CBS 119918]|uniref:Cytochrome P450 oxidoreductase n=1 Tax=Exophiala aquamarina CBS 119918 TaxID=1182545 RepID=A0A072NTG3_9EURO|nr:uncharacterized protein A1O9_13011 [Exophiala aquamarina CBS 119918]KEF50931.1 hypothetical protein A1O9_13011 [Exophiala aquamarina CBS 119918]